MNNTGFQVCTKEISDEIKEMDDRTRYRVFLALNDPDELYRQRHHRTLHRRKERFCAPCGRKYAHGAFQPHRFRAGLLPL